MQAWSGLAPGRQLDSYDIVRRLGQGGMGVVYLARDRTLGRKVALKVVHPHHVGTEDAVERFLFEARATAHLIHPHIVTVYGAGEVDGAPYIAFEYLDGESLRERLARDRPSLGEALEFGFAIAEAIAEAHRRGVLHRDLKPDNVFLPKDGRLRVLDFGLAKSLAPTEPSEAHAIAQASTLDVVPHAFASQAHGIKGTPAYMAPEQWRADRELTAAVDVWAIGVILFEMLTGRLPFEAGTALALALRVTAADPAPRITDLLPGLSAELADAVARCLHKEAAQRPSAAEVGEVLTRLSRGQRRAVGPSHDASPYRGLLPFRMEHADIFFGRDAEIAAFLERLRLSPLLPVIGPSGAGKSSFVMAGVLPMLARRGGWTLFVMRPGSDPYKALAQALSKDITSADRASLSGAADEALVGQLRAAPAAIGTTLRSRAAASHGRVLLFVDQFEELYTLAPDPLVRRAFGDALAIAGDDADGPVRVVITIRDDFLGRLAEHPGMVAALDNGTTLLRTPGESALAEVLAGPLEPLGYAFEDRALVEEMVNGVAAAPACLPLLQFAAQRLWDGRDRARRLLLRSTYDAMGGVEGALADHADGVLDAMPPPQAKLARLVLLRLTTAEGTRQTVPRGALIAEVGPEAALTIDRLVEARLVVRRRVAAGEHEGAEGDDAKLELAHEALLTRWAQLRRWLEEAREDVASLEQLRSAARTWAVRGKRGEDLWRGESLADALRWRRRFSERMPDEVTAFLQASSDLAERVLRRKRRLRVAVLLVAMVVAALSSLVALVIARKEEEARRAGAAARESMAQALVSDAQAALQREDYPEARAKLRSSFEVADSPTARALWMRLGKDPQVFVAHVGNLLYVVAFRGARTVGTTGSMPVAHLWDIETGHAELLRDLASENWGLAFSPNGLRAAAGGVDGTVTLFDLEHGRRQRFFRAHPQNVRQIAYSPDGRLVLSRSDEGALRLWDATQSAPVQTMPADTKGTSRFAISPDGQLLALAQADGRIRVHHVTDWHLITSLGNDETAVGGALVWSPDGSLIAVPSRRDSVQVWSAAAANLVRNLPARFTPESIAFHPHGAFLAMGGLGSGGGIVALWDYARGHEIAWWRAHDSYTGLAFSADGTLMATESFDKKVRVWNIRRTVAARSRSASHGGDVSGLAFSPDGTTVASGSWDNQVLLWDLKSSRARVLGSHAEGVRMVAYSPDGRRLASASNDRTIRIWDVASGALTRTLFGHEHMVWDVAFLPGGERLASSSYDNTVAIWDIAKARRIQTIPDGQRGIAVSSDGKSIWGAGATGLWVWDASNARATHLSAGPAGFVYQIALSPDAAVLAAGAMDGAIWLWDARSRKRRDIWRGHAKRVNTVRFSPDGALLASGSDDGTARIWNALDGRTIRVIRHMTSGPGIMAFSPDGRLLVGADDRTVRTWEVATGHPYWRAPLLLLRPEPLLLTHEGVLRLPVNGRTAVSLVPPSTLPSGLRVTVEAVDARAVIADASGDGSRVVFVTPDDTVELWDVDTGHRIAVQPVPFVDRALLAGGGFVTLAAGSVELWQCRPGGAACETSKLVEREAASVSVSDNRILVGAGPEVRIFSLTGEQRSVVDVDYGVSAGVLTNRRLVFGFSDGSFEHRLPDGRRPDMRVSFEETPGQRVTALAEGPLDTIVAGFTDGTVGLWSLTDGRRLDLAKLHGPVVHIAVRDGMAYAATEVGDYLAWNLRDLERPYCDVLHDLWKEIRVVWESGATVERAPAARHACAPR